MCLVIHVFAQIFEDLPGKGTKTRHGSSRQRAGGVLEEVRCVSLTSHDGKTLGWKTEGGVTFTVVQKQENWLPPGRSGRRYESGI